MESYEDAILEYQENNCDECRICEYKRNCRSQCMETHEIYNPVFDDLRKVIV